MRWWGCGMHQLDLSMVAMQLVSQFSKMQYNTMLFQCNPWPNAIHLIGHCNATHWDAVQSDLIHCVSMQLSLAKSTLAVQSYYHSGNNSAIRFDALCPFKRWKEQDTNISSLKSAFFFGPLCTLKWQKFIDQIHPCGASKRKEHFLVPTGCPKIDLVNFIQCKRFIFWLWPIDHCIDAGCESWKQRQHFESNPSSQRLPKHFQLVPTWT